MRPVRLAYLVTHPIQYQAPLLRAIAADPAIELEVFFCSDHSVRQFFDREFGRKIEWDVPLLDGYAHRFLPTLYGRDRLGFWLPVNYGLARALRQGGFDALWVHGYARWLHWVALGAAKRLGLATLVRDEAWQGGMPRGALKRRLKHVFFRLLDRLCDAYLAIGTESRRYALANGIAADKITIMPYAVDNERFQTEAHAASPRREALRAELGLAPDRPVILYASKLIARKHADDLLEAFARIAAGPRARRPYLVLVGDGELRPALEARIAELKLDSVRLTGFKGQSELPTYYDLADVFVLPSTHEQWGLVVNEVMNAGRAIVVTDQVGCAADLVRPGENGFVVPAQDVAALAHALEEVLADPERCRAMGRRSLAIIERWGFREDIAALNAALDRVLARRARA